MLTTASTSSSPPASCWTKTRNCLCSPKTIQSVKAAVLFAGMGASLLIPVPFLNGFLHGASLFLGAHELFKHPSSTTMLKYENWTLSRTWKHITAGAITAGTGTGLSILLLSLSPPKHALGAVLIPYFAGLAAAFAIYSSDACCMGNYRTIEPIDSPSNGSDTI